MVPAHWKGRSISQEHKRIPAFEDALQRKDFGRRNKPGIPSGHKLKTGYQEQDRRSEDQKTNRIIYDAIIQDGIIAP